jgi:predicted enzyme related to lactoylglutathione lyase
VGRVHRSRIGVVLIDHPEGDWESALAFWAGVRGIEPTVGSDPVYRGLGWLGGVELASQRLGDGTPARVHLDIETDDVRAEVARVVALGATVLDDRDEYAILADPGGLVFCVVPVQSPENFERDASTWD